MKKLLLVAAIVLIAVTLSATCAGWHWGLGAPKRQAGWAWDQTTTTTVDATTVDLSPGNAGAHTDQSS